MRESHPHISSAAPSSASHVANHVTVSPSASSERVRRAQHAIAKLQQKAAHAVSPAFQSRSRHRSGRRRDTGNSPQPPEDGSRRQFPSPCNQSRADAIANPADFKPDEIVRVVNNTHLVGLSVANANRAAGRCERRHGESSLNTSLGAASNQYGCTCSIVPTVIKWSVLFPEDGPGR